MSDRIKVEGRRTELPIIRVSLADYERRREHYREQARFAHVEVVEDEETILTLSPRSTERTRKHVELPEEGMIDPLTWAHYVASKQ